MLVILYTVIAILVIYWLVQATKKPKNFPPGPPRLPLVGGIPYFLSQKSKGSPLHMQIESSRKYGKIWGAYFGSMPVVYISDFDIAKDVMNMEEASGRPAIGPIILRPGFGHPDLEGGAPGVIVSQGNHWREERRFALRNLRDRGFGKATMEESLLEEVEKISNYFSSKKGQPVDLNLGFNISILNALWVLLMGEKMDLDDPKVTKVVNSVNDMIKTAGAMPIIAALLPKKEMIGWPILKTMCKTEIVEMAMNDMLELIKQNVRSHNTRLKEIGVEEDDLDFMDTFLKRINSGKGNNFTLNENSLGYNALLNTFIDLFLAGSETTSTSLVWTMLYMVHHPEVQRKAQKEIDMVVGSSRPVSLDDSKDLPYVNAVLQESFRLTCLVFHSAPHSAMKDFTVKGYFFPKGTLINTCLFDIMRDPDRYENPDIFMPERFIDSSGNFIKDDHVIPFGIGKRYCLGQSLAEREFFLFYTGLMQKFTFKNYPGATLPGYGLHDTYPQGAVRTPPENFRVIIEERE